VWGRGALDVKVTLMQQLEAVELLLRQGHTPARTLYFAFGHDEEVGGGSGAALQRLCAGGVLGLKGQKQG
jgi:carboxypeptidase PM20D1